MTKTLKDFISNGNQLDWDYVPHLNSRCMDCDGEEDFCENHTHLYLFNKENYIVHDTNNNSAWIVGEVPIEWINSQALFDYLGTIIDEPFSENKKQVYDVYMYKKFGLFTE